jgi:hypothetical protein
MRPFACPPLLHEPNFCFLWIFFGFLTRKFHKSNMKIDSPNRQIDGLAPTFLKKPAIRQEDDGKRLLFECLIKADPTPSVRWSHNTSDVENNDRHKVDSHPLVKPFTTSLTFFLFTRTVVGGQRRPTILRCP